MTNNLEPCDLSSVSTSCATTQDYATKINAEKYSLTVITATSNIGKRRTLDREGQLVKGPVRMPTNAKATRHTVPTLRAFDKHLQGLRATDAITHGVTQFEACAVTTQSNLAAAQPGTVARDGMHFHWPDGPGLMLVDLDFGPEDSEPVVEDIDARLCRAVPGLGFATRLYRHSGSSHIIDSEIGLPLTGIAGLHLYIGVDRAADIPVIGQRSVDRLMLMGDVGVRYTRSGTPMVRTLIDAKVWQPERLDFIKADLGPGLEQHIPPGEVFDGRDVNRDVRLTIDMVPALDAAEVARLNQIKRGLLAAPAVVAEAARLRHAWAIEAARKANPTATGDELEQAAVHIAERATAGQLFGDYVITFSNGETATVDDICADPEKYHDRRCSDPLDDEGDKRIGIVLGKRTNGRSGPAIHSHMHGGRVFDLVSSVGFDNCDVIPRDGTRRDRQKAENVRLQETDNIALPSILTVDEMETDCVWIGEGSNVGLLSDPRQVLSFHDFAGIMAASTTEVVDDDVSQTTGKKKRSREIPNASIWRGLATRKTVMTRTFHAGAQQICHDPDGKLALNSWRRIERHPSAADIGPFLDQTAYLFPIVEDREMFLDWLAHIEQRPGELPHFGWLHIAANTGTGRNWLASLLARVWRGQVAPNVDLPGLLDSAFNSALAARVLAIVDEVQEGGNDKYRHISKLKSLVNAEFRDVNPKCIRQFREHNACRWLVFSNHDDALPLNDTDRRWWVVRHAIDPRPPGAYSTLYRLLGDAEFINAVAVYLKERDISGFNPGQRPPMTDAKRAALSASKSLIQTYALELVAACPADIATNRHIAFFLSDGASNTTFTSAMRRALEELGCERTGVVKINGEAQRCWILRNADHWRGKPSGELAVEAHRAAMVVETPAGVDLFA